jgi:hypothetical protein
MTYVDKGELNAFDPHAIAAMDQAYKEACIMLRIYAGDERGKTAVASRVIGLARTSIIDPGVLRDRVVQEARVAAGVTQS